MGANTKIEWTDHTFNPWRGCEHAVLPDGTRHPGCDHCYAEAMSKRNPSVLGEWGAVGKRIRAADDYWKLPLKWNAQAERAGERRRVFCASLADVFEDWQGPILNHNGERLYRGAGAYSAKKFRMTGKRRFPASMNDLRRDLFRLIDATPNLDWLLLTKRPENVERMWCSHVNTDGMPPSRLHRHNVWLGCSVSDQSTADAMIPELLKLRDLTPVLFVSAEPLLDAIDFSNYLGGINEIVPDNITNSERREAISWLILGGESGPHARPCNLHWIRSIRDQCKAASVPCFVKQLGSRCFDSAQWEEGNEFTSHQQWVNKAGSWLGGVSGGGVRYKPRENVVCVDAVGRVCTTGGDFKRAEDEGTFPVRWHHVMQLRDPKGGDWDEWPEDLRVRELPEVQP